MPIERNLTSLLNVLHKVFAAVHTLRYIRRYCKKYSHKIKSNKNVFTTELSMNTSVTHKLICST